MEQMTSSLPDISTWKFDDNTAEAHLPSSEVLSIYKMIDYLGQQLAACHAVKSPN